MHFDTLVKSSLGAEANYCGSTGNLNQSLNDIAIVI